MAAKSQGLVEDIVRCDMDKKAVASAVVGLGIAWKERCG
jgi:hypothetical protein